ncbi:putative cation:proton antiport protein [Citrobacter freundii]|nr:putative cation:proton antiport protein [Citrobacter freundii]
MAMKRVKLSLQHARSCPSIEIIARAHYDDEVDYITERGANQVVMGEREIARTMLELIETPPASEVVVTG